MIKASAGGGGKGIRIAFNDEEFKMDIILQKLKLKHVLEMILYILKNMFKNQSI